MTIYELTYTINGEPGAEYALSKSDTLRRKAQIYRDYKAAEMNQLVKITATKANAQMVLAILNRQPWALKREVIEDFTK